MLSLDLFLFPLSSFHMCECRFKEVSLNLLRNVSGVHDVLHKLQSIVSQLAVFDDVSTIEAKRARIFTWSLAPVDRLIYDNLLVDSVGLETMLLDFEANYFAIQVELTLACPIERSLVGVPLPRIDDESDSY